MLRRHIANAQIRISAILIIFGLCVFFALGSPSAAKLAKSRHASLRQEPSLAATNIYRQTNLVSDVPFLAQMLDPLLVNPWGISQSATSPFWVADQGTSKATLYGGDVGSNPAFKNPLNVTIPGGVPTGIVFSGSSTDFAVTSGGVTSPARFMFASLSGNIVGWRAGTSGVIAASHPGHVYTGLAIGNNGVANFLYAADFANRNIDVYDKNFALTTLGTFIDPTLPAGYAPFNVQNLSGKLYVMYAKVDPSTGEDQAGPGNGYVSTFDTNGNFLARVVSNGSLNSPWGVTIAPAGFGAFANALLVGNFGDGRINAYNVTTGAYLGTLDDQSGNPLEIEKLWAITFGNGVGGGDTNTLYFAAGVGDEEHGIFGKLNSAVAPFISFQFSSNQYVVAEGADFVTITVNRTGELNAATVNYSTIAESSPGHASPVNDFIPAGGTLSFAAGETSKTFKVLIINDTNLEGDEHFAVVLSNPTGAGLGAVTHADVKIAENDSPTAISPAQKTFVASLDGGHEVPPRTSNGTGTGVVIITDEATGAAKMSLTFSGLTSNAVAAHIHGPAVDGQNAAVLFPITVPAATSGSANDVPFTMTPTQISQLKNGLFYFNIHTSNFPGGEIRGQIYFNPIDEAGYFVRQNYLDFLNRNPDTPGLNYWTGQITGCGVNALCISNRRIDVSAAFFFAQEFQTTDFFVYRIRKASYGQLPTLSQFTLDRGSIASGSDPDMKAFSEAFVQNGEFLGVYPTTMNGSDYIDKLIATVLAGSGVDLTSRKPDLSSQYLLEVTQTASRARVLRRLVGYPEFITAEFNRGFVATEYYGYLRRTPDAGGFNFWLGVLNNGVPGNSRSMVCAFITSAEYQLRFGPTVTRSNVECATVAP